MKQYIALFILNTTQVYEKELVIAYKVYKVQKMIDAEERAKIDVLDLGLQFNQIKKMEVRVFLMEPKEFLSDKLANKNKQA